MGTIRKINDIFFIEFYARGLMYSQIAGDSEEGAQKMLEQVEAKIATGEALTIVREIDLEIFFEKFLGYAHDKFSAKSIQRFVRMWGHFLRFLKKNYPQLINLSQVTPSILEAYKSLLVKEEKPKVVNLSILLLREVLEFGIKIGFLNDNPSLHVRLLQTPYKILRSSTRSQMAKDLLMRNVSLEKVYLLLKLKDVAQVIYWSNFIPLNREDTYA